MLSLRAGCCQPDIVNGAPFCIGNDRCDFPYDNSDPEKYMKCTSGGVRRPPTYNALGLTNGIAVFAGNISSLQKITHLRRASERSPLEIPDITYQT